MDARVSLDGGHRIVCFASYYLPGVRSGGPLRSLLHMQEWLGQSYQFHIVTRNHDLGDKTPYPDVSTGHWCDVGGAKVWYLAAPYWAPSALRRAFQGTPCDLLYFHSAFDAALTIMPLILRRLGWLPRQVPVLVAPRGEFSAGARSIKAAKKSMFLAVSKVLNLYKDVTWHATGPEEAEEIRALWGREVPVLIAPNLPSKAASTTALLRQPKQPDALKLVFLSRISRKKNLHGALEILRGVKANVELDIYGAREDAVYWDECSRLMEQLPRNISARYRGVASLEAVIPILSEYDAFLLPTLGENFGHVIFEALLSGCPVVLSDQTPWRDLEDGRAGFDIPLSQPEQFQRAIERLAAMDATELGEWSGNARRLALRYSDNPELVQRTRAMIETAMIESTVCS